MSSNPPYHFPPAEVPSDAVCAPKTPPPHSIVGSIQSWNPLAFSPSQFFGGGGEEKQKAFADAMKQHLTSSPGPGPGSPPSFFPPLLSFTPQHLRSSAYRASQLLNSDSPLLNLSNINNNNNSGFQEIQSKKHIKGLNDRQFPLSSPQSSPYPPIPPPPLPSSRGPIRLAFEISGGILHPDVNVKSEEKKNGEEKNARARPPFRRLDEDFAAQDKSDNNLHTHSNDNPNNSSNSNSSIKIEKNSSIELEGDLVDSAATDKKHDESIGTLPLCPTSSPLPHRLTPSPNPAQNHTTTTPAHTPASWMLMSPIKGKDNTSSNLTAGVLDTSPLPPTPLSTPIPIFMPSAYATYRVPLSLSIHHRANISPAGLGGDNILAIHRRANASPAGLVGDTGGEFSGSMMMGDTRNTSHLTSLYSPRRPFPRRTALLFSSPALGTSHGNSELDEDGGSRKGGGERELNTPTSIAVSVRPAVAPAPRRPTKQRATTTHMGKNSIANIAQCKGCNCRKSKCLKLYCECFQRQGYCNADCKCLRTGELGCLNLPQFKEEREKAIQLTLERDSQAFFRSKEETIVTNGDGTAKQHSRGCRCKRSECLKKYCECYQAGLSCSENCKCDSCKNGKPPGTGGGDDGSEAIAVPISKESHTKRSKAKSHSSALPSSLADIDDEAAAAFLNVAEPSPAPSATPGSKRSRKKHSDQSSLSMQPEQLAPPHLPDHVQGSPSPPIMAFVADDAAVGTDSEGEDHADVAADKRAIFDQLPPLTPIRLGRKGQKRKHTELLPDSFAALGTLATIGSNSPRYGQKTEEYRAVMARHTNTTNASTTNAASAAAADATITNVNADSAGGSSPAAPSPPQPAQSSQLTSPPTASLVLSTPSTQLLTPQDSNNNSNNNAAIVNAPDTVQATLSGGESVSLTGRKRKVSTALAAALKDAETTTSKKGIQWSSHPIRELQHKGKERT